MKPIGFLLSGLAGLLLTSTLSVAQTAGSLDWNFGNTDQASGLWWKPRDIGADGKILVVRDITSDVPLHLCIARLDRSGNYDSLFRPASVSCKRVSEAVFDGPVVAAAPDGKVLVTMRYGHFMLPDGRPVDLLRLQKDGELDPSFVPVPREIAPGGYPRPWRHIGELTVLPDNRILYGLTRVHPDGSVDLTYKPSESEAENTLPSVRPLQTNIVLREVLPDNSLLMARLNTDGVVQEIFRVPQWSRRYPVQELRNLQVISMLIEPDGNLLLTTVYDTVSGSFPRELETIRIYGDGQPYIWPHTVRRQPNGGFEFELTAATNRTVIIEARADLNAAPWMPISTFPPAVDRGIMKVTDPTFDQRHRIYRAVAK
jgi:hypothetical protein